MSKHGERKRPTRFVGVAGLAAATAIFCAVATTGTAAGERIDGDVRAGYNTDLEDGLIGGGVLFGVGNSGRWFANPNAEIVFADFGEQYSLSGDFHYDFRLGSTGTYWLGLGPAIVHREFDFGGDDTDVGANLLAGIGKTTGKVRPYVQGRVTLKDDTEAALVVGIRF